MDVNSRTTHPRSLCSRASRNLRRRGGGSAPTNSDRHGGAGDHGERDRQFEFFREGIDFDRTDDDGYGEDGFEQGEMIADAGAGAATEQKVLPAVLSAHVLWAESLRVDCQGAGPPEVWGTVHAEDADLSLLPAATGYPSTSISRSAVRPATATGGHSRSASWITCVV